MSHASLLLLLLLIILWPGMVYDPQDQDAYRGFIMEYVSKGDLLHYMEHEPTKGAEQAHLLLYAIFFFRQVLKAISICNYGGVVHRDLHLKNILKSGNLLKINDLGLSTWRFQRGLPHDVRSTAAIGMTCTIPDDARSGEDTYDLKNFDTLGAGFIGAQLIVWGAGKGCHAISSLRPVYIARRTPPPTQRCAT